ncbi:MAG: hypothetical protein DWQ04_18510 [Chloroflexi bacterium]|nr:MAG: hypothetical protein DWQ04_18510 [Chloroflexota bacterium]
MKAASTFVTNHCHLLCQGLLRRLWPCVLTVLLFFFGFQPFLLQFMKQSDVLFKNAAERDCGGWFVQFVCEEFVEASSKIAQFRC